MTDASTFRSQQKLWGCHWIMSDIARFGAYWVVIEKGIARLIPTQTLEVQSSEVEHLRFTLKSEVFISKTKKHR